jgi:phospholipase/carboxylesterase
MYTGVTNVARATPATVAIVVSRRVCGRNHVAPRAPRAYRARMLSASHGTTLTNTHTRGAPFATIVMIVTIGLALAHCTPASSPNADRQRGWRPSALEGYRLGRLSVRVGVTSDNASARTGRQRIDAGGSARGGLVLVPASYDPARPLPLLLLLHGAGGSADRITTLLAPALDSARMIVVAPDSRGVTWDFIRGPFGPDIAFIDSVLHDVVSHYRVDSSRVMVAGFSDGASYALSLGMSNGDLFSRVVAFSPGMAGVVGAHGLPAIFVSHGTRDPILSFEYTSSHIVPQLRAAGYDVTLREFDGTHTVPPAVARDAVGWLLSSGAAK